MLMVNHIVSSFVQLNDRIAVSLDLSLECLMLLNLGLETKGRLKMLHTSALQNRANLQIRRIFVIFLLCSLQFFKNPQFKLMGVALEILILASFFQLVGFHLGQMPKLLIVGQNLVTPILKLLMKISFKRTDLRVQQSIT